MNYCLLFLLLVGLNAKAQVTVCYIPIENNYHVAIRESKIQTHSDAKCTTFYENNIYDKINFILNNSNPCKDTLCNERFNDYRVSILLGEGEKSEQIFVTRFGYVMLNNKMFKPNRKLLRYLSKLIGIHW